MKRKGEFFPVYAGKVYGCSTDIAVFTFEFDAGGRWLTPAPAAMYPSANRFVHNDVLSSLRKRRIF
jgi:hypothetical protein